MSLSCLVKGHDFEKVGETFFEDLQDSFYASNYGTGIYISKYGQDVYQCKKCLMKKHIPNGKGD